MVKKTLISLTLLCTLTHTALAAYTESELKNKENVIDFYNKALNDKDFDAARPYLGNEYIQHNPGAKDGPEGFRQFITFLKEKFPDSHSEIKRVIVDGDYVVLHVASTGREAGVTRAIIDIFRLNTQHKIVEHWDVIQTVPEKTASGNGMF
ncbi:putative SnoaL-like aldol condensation-catalyzing enzyme [Raoultella ornithinolytica]|uniref:SnoaL-like aldol condensation-catalyzing enzyme n=1 Tax=Raoultella ornithinolytica TaxID=54291 RepID=A0ABD7QJ53_RAOOR|nr:putative SnoaL-like aldol condensation-catalyzing enzyme [Raoultella ornithinolytica]